MLFFQYIKDKLFKKKLESDLKPESKSPTKGTIFLLAISELVMLVLGILLALYIDRWNEKQQIEEKFTAALKIILSDKNVKGILINIFGGIMRCDVLAQGVVDAAKEINISVPLVVRLAGTNFKEGKEILDNSGLKLISAENLDDAAQKIVEAIK